MGRYRKIDVRIWNDEKFRALSDDAKLAFIFMLTHPYMTSIGAMRGTVPGLAAELPGWSSERLSKALAEVIGKAMVKHDADAAAFWLPNFIRYNPPENPNVLKAWAAAVDLLPECSVTREAIDAVSAFAKGLSKAFQDALPEPFGKHMAKQEQEPLPEPETKPRAVPAPMRAKNGDEDPDFVRAMAMYPKREGSNPSADAWKAWKTRRREGVEAAEMIAGAERYLRFTTKKGQVGSSFVMQASRFFGPSMPFREPWEVQAIPNGGARADAWWTSDEATQRKGRDLGMQPRAGESMPSYRERISQRIENEKRAA